MITVRGLLQEVLGLQQETVRRQWARYTCPDGRAEVSTELSNMQDALRAALTRLHVSSSVLSRPLSAHLGCLWVEAHPDVRALRCVFDGDEDPQPARAADALLEICATRNALARSRGHASYPHMVLTSQCLAPRPGDGYASVLRYMPAPGPQDARAWAIPSMERYWSTYSTLLGGGTDETTINCRQLIDDLLLGLGISDVADRLEIVVCDQPHAAGMAMDLAKRGERRAGILLRPGGLRAAFVAAHELGHALLYLLRRGDLPYIPAWLDEGYARRLESDDVVMLPALVAQADSEIASSWMADRATLRHFEIRRLHASVLTEDCLWRTVDRSDLAHSGMIECVTAFCADVHARLLGTSYESPLGWAQDSFRSIDPVYVHSYAMADSVARYLGVGRPCSRFAPYDVSIRSCVGLAKLAATRSLHGIELLEAGNGIETCGNEG